MVAPGYTRLTSTVILPNPIHQAFLANNKERPISGEQQVEPSGNRTHGFLSAIDKLVLSIMLIAYIWWYIVHLVTYIWD